MVSQGTTRSNTRWKRTRSGASWEEAGPWKNRRVVDVGDLPRETDVPYCRDAKNGIVHSVDETEPVFDFDGGGDDPLGLHVVSMENG